MSVIIPLINPVRLILTSSGHEQKTIDYSAIYPRIDMMFTGIKYQKGIYPISYVPDFIIDEAILLQFQHTTDGPTFPPSITVRLYNAETGTYTSGSVTDITPASWEGYKVKRLNCTPSSEGFYYITLRIDFYSSSDKEFRSDTFQVRTTTETSQEKDIHQIQFKNSINDFNMVFSTYYKAYYTGIISPIAPQVEKSTFDLDTGPNIQRSYSYRKIKITLTDIHMAYIDVIGLQLQCDSILINGIEYISLEGFTTEETEKSDVVNIIANLTLKSNNYSMNYL